MLTSDAAGASAPAKPIIAFDDAGNTGQNLLDPDQQVFVLASVRLDDAVARELAAHARGPRLTEAKFTQLRRRESHQKRVLDVLRSDVFTPDTVRFAIFHKPFLVTTFMVDLLVEPLAYATGFNLYEDRANLGLANLLQAVTDAFCGAGSLRELQRRFVAAAMAKTPDAARQAVHAFYEVVDRLQERNQDRSFADSLGMLTATSLVASHWVGRCDPVALDPAVPAFSDLAAQWTAALGRPFTIAHDRSKPIEHQQEVLEGFMRDDGETRTFDAGTTPRAFPVLADGIHFFDSAEVSQIQIADLLAGAAATIMEARARGGAEEDRFAEALVDTQLRHIPFDPIWPSLNVTPDALGGNGHDAAPAIDYVAKLARERRSSKSG